MAIYSFVIHTLFSLALFINAVLFIPQAIRIFKAKSSESVSLVTFLGFVMIQFTCVLYGLLKDDWILTIGFLTAMATCSSVVIMAFIYRISR